MSDFSYLQLFFIIFPSWVWWTCFGSSRMYSLLLPTKSPFSSTYTHFPSCFLITYEYINKKWFIWNLKFKENGRNLGTFIFWYGASQLLTPPQTSGLEGPSQHLRSKKSCVFRMCSMMKAPNKNITFWTGHVELRLDWWDEHPFYSGGRARYRPMHKSPQSSKSCGDCSTTNKKTDNDEN